MGLAKGRIWLSDWAHTHTLGTKLSLFFSKFPPPSPPTYSQQSLSHFETLSKDSVPFQMILDVLSHIVLSLILWDRVALLITGSAKVIVLEAPGDRVRTGVHIPFPSSGSSSHQFTLQFCPWSNFRLLGDHMGPWCESFQMSRDAYLRAAKVNDISLSGLEWLWFF